MKILYPSATNITVAIDTLQKGGIVAHATETCYGLACALTNQEAVRKLFHIKDRPETAPISGLFANIESSRKYVQWTPDSEVLAAKYYPGPITIILPIVEESELFPTPDGGTTLGVRISSHEVAHALALQCTFPISTTSANVHSKPNTYSTAEILDQFANLTVQPDLILDSGTLEQRDASTVIDYSSGEMQILRRGDIRPI